MQRSKALEAAKEIWDDLSDRSGFGLECIESDDPDTHEEIMTRMAVIILKKASVEPERQKSVPDVDPWELLRNVAKTLHRRNVDNARWYDVMSELDRIDEALKQHDTERTSDV